MADLILAPNYVEPLKLTPTVEVALSEYETSASSSDDEEPIVKINDLK